MSNDQKSVQASDTPTAKYEYTNLSPRELILDLKIDTLIQMIKKDPTGRLLQSDVNSCLCTIYRSDSTALTNEQRYQYTCMVIKDCTVPSFARTLRFDEAHAECTINNIVDSLVKHNLIEGTAKNSGHLTYDESYITEHFYQETSYYIPEFNQPAYQAFVKRYLSLPYLFEGGYEYRSFNMKFGFLTALFFLATTPNHDISAKGSLSEDPTILTLIDFWKANSYLWRDENGIVPRIDNFNIVTTLDGKKTITISKKTV